MTRTGIAMLIVIAVAGNYMRFMEPSVPPGLGVETLRIGASADFVVQPLGDDFLDVLRAEESSFVTYDATSDAPVWVFLGYFSQQREGSQVHSPKHCYPGSGWTIEGEATIGAPWGNGKVNALTVSDGHQRRRVYYWFQTPEAVMDGVLRLKLDLTRKALLRRPQEVVFARVSTVLDGDPGSAEARLANFATELNQEIAKLYERQK